MPASDYKKILLVDRVPGRDRLRAALTGSGYAVVTVGDCARAAAMIAAGFRPDAVVFGVAGDQAASEGLERLHESEPTLPVVLLHDGEVDESVVRGLRRVAVLPRRDVDSRLDDTLMRVTAPAARRSRARTATS